MNEKYAKLLRDFQPYGHRTAEVDDAQVAEVGRSILAGLLAVAQSIDNVAGAIRTYDPDDDDDSDLEEGLVFSSQK
jgi:hypothetical protein